VSRPKPERLKLSPGRKPTGPGQRLASCPEEARYPEARAILTPGPARDLLQSPEGGRDRYFRIDSPFSAPLPKEGAST